MPSHALLICKVFGCVCVLTDAGEQNKQTAFLGSVQYNRYYRYFS